MLRAAAPLPQAAAAAMVVPVENVAGGGWGAGLPASTQADAEQCGIGLRLAAAAGVGGFYHVDGLEPGGPAARSKKVLEGDVLLMVDGVSVRGMDVATLSKVYASRRTFAHARFLACCYTSGTAVAVVAAFSSFG